MYNLDFVYKLGGRFAGFSIIEKDNRAITPYKTTPAPTRMSIVYGYVCMFMYVYVCLRMYMFVYDEHVLISISAWILLVFSSGTSRLN